MAKESSSGKEIELKYRVADPSAFAALAAAMSSAPSTPAKQVNHFFDTSDFRLNAAKYTIRLREETGAFLLTAKGPQITSHQGSLTSKSEAEFSLEGHEAKMILDGKGSPLDVLGQRATQSGAALVAAIREIVAGAKLRYVGSFQNDRSRLNGRLQMGNDTLDVQFEMDRTTFPGSRVDYEIEVEIKEGVDVDAATAAVNAFLARARISSQKAPSKAKRFFDVVTGNK